MVSCNPQLSVEGDEYVCGWDETDSFCNGHHCEVCSISLCNLDCGDEYCARTRTAADREATVCMLCKHPLEEGEAFNQFAYDWFKDGKRIEWSYGKFHYPEDSDSETFDVEFDEWADQEMMTHGKDISFKDWAEDEGMKHGNTEITEWAQHEDESHDARFGAEEIWCDSCGEDGLSGDFHVITSMPVDFDSGSAGESATLCGDCYSKYGAEELKKDSCCCGATKSNPCACMIQGVMECNATCPCSLEKKGAESMGDDGMRYSSHKLCPDCGATPTSAWIDPGRCECGRVMNPSQYTNISFGAESLKRDSCCCGATKSNPCACMIQGVMECSDTCPCSLEKKGAETFEDSWEKGVIRLAIDSGCFSDEYAEWVSRQIDGASSTLNNPRFKKIIDKRWGLSAEGFQYHDSYDNCDQCGEKKGLHDLFGEVGTCDDCLIPKRHNGEKYKTVLGACVVCRGEDGDRGCDFCDLAYCDSGCFEEHIEDGEADGRNCDMEHIKGKEGWGAENWGGDPKGKLALALQKARDKAKEPKKPLKIEKLGVETSGQYCEYCEEHHPDEVWDICNAHHYDKYAYAAESFSAEVSTQLEPCINCGEISRSKTLNDHDLCVDCEWKNYGRCRDCGDIQKMMAYTNYRLCESCMDARGAESFATEGKSFVCDACEETLPLKLRNRSLKVAQEFGMGIGDICRPCVKRIKSYEEEVKKLNPPKTWADYYNAPTKGIDTFTQPFEESSLDSGGLKKVLVGLAIGGLAYLGYNKWK